GLRIRRIEGEAMPALWRLLTFRGSLGRRDFAVAAIAVLVVQHGLIEITDRLLAHDTQSLDLLAHFSLNLLYLNAGGPGIWLLFIVLAGMASWILGALALARARSAGASPALALCCIIPVLQIGAIFLLAGAPVTASGERADRWVPT